MCHLNNIVVRLKIIGKNLEIKKKKDKLCVSGVWHHYFTKFIPIKENQVIFIIFFFLCSYADRSGSLPFGMFTLS